MSFFSRLIDKIQRMSDGPGLLDSDADGYVLRWNNAAGKFEAAPPSGGGTTDHAALSNLDYANSGHTGFAGTGIANIFTRGQSIAAAIADLIDGGYLLSERLSNGDFATGDLTDWNDDASGWSVVANGGGYALSHTPGSDGTLTQDVAGISGEVFVLQFTVSGMTTGFVEVYGSENLDYTADNNGTWRSIGYVASDPTTITVYVSSDFDGLITDVSLKQSSVGFPPVLFLSDALGNFNEIRISGSSFFWGPNAGKRSSPGGGGGNIGFGDSALDSIYLEALNTAFGAGAGQGARCNGGVFFGPGTGIDETVDYRMHIGNNGDIISGQINFGDAATQTLKFHAKNCNFADVPTDATGLNPGDLYNDGGFAKFA